MKKIFVGTGRENLRLFIEYSGAGCLEQVFSTLSEYHLQVKEYQMGVVPYPATGKNNCCTVTVRCRTKGISGEIIERLKQTDGITRVYVT